MRMRMTNQSACTGPRKARGSWCQLIKRRFGAGGLGESYGSEELGVCCSRNTIFTAMMVKKYNGK